MVNTDILSAYYGGVIVFTRPTQVSTSAGNTRNYVVGEEIHITAAVLHMIGSDILPKENIKLVLRKLEQLENSEILELSYIVFPGRSNKLNGSLPSIRKVHRQGEGKTYTIEVTIDKTRVLERSMVINSLYDIAISEIIHPPFSSKPTITQTAATNQLKAFRWLMSKHLDVLQLIPKRKAVGRKNWTKEGYETPGHPRFK